MAHRLRVRALSLLLLLARAAATVPGSPPSGVQIAVSSCNSNLRWLVNLSYSYDVLILEKCGKNKPDGDKPGKDMIAKDIEAALHFYRKAVELGHEKAKVNLGVALYTGAAGEKDVDAAEALWMEAHEAGVSQAGFCLRNMEKRGRMEPMFEEK